MAFEIKNTPILHFEEIAIFNSISKTCIKILTKGAILNQWLTPYSDTTLDIMDGNTFDGTWNGFEQNGFKGGKMSPFSCRLKEGKYSINDTTYCIEKFYLDKHAIHGIIYDAVYQIKNIETSDNATIVKLQFDYQGTDKGYPFPFFILVSYTLTSDDKVIVSTTIINKSNQIIPLMDGWHPYFKLDKKVDSLELTFQNQGKVVYDNELIPTGNFIKDDQFDHGKALGSMHLDDCYQLKEHAKLILKGKQIYLEMTPLKNYPYLQLYTPNHRQSIAIENLSGIPNCFNNKIGLQNLKPNEEIEFITQFKTFQVSL